MDLDCISAAIPQPGDLPAPDSVTTPGRTWTQFPADGFDRGGTTVQVEAPDAVEVLDLAAARDAGLVDELLCTGFDPAQDAVAAAHAREATVTVVRVPGGTVLEEPVRVVVEAEGGLAPHHVLLWTADGVHAPVELTHTGSGRPATLAVEARAGEDAVLDVTLANRLDGGHGYTDLHATAAADATVRWTLASTGSELYRNRVTTRLDGSHAALDYRLAFLGAEEQHLDHTAHVVHAADGTRCDIDARGVALDESRTVYKGVQEVLEGAEGTESFQDERTVMVGEGCEADTTPQLRIDNSDVEATHAATTGHVDETDLCYMRSRGVTERRATRMIIEGMLDDLVAETRVARETIRSAVTAVLA